MIEDYPFALNATKAGYHYSYLDKDTVIYRVVEKSTSHSGNNKIYNNLEMNKQEFNILYRFPYLPIKERNKEIFEFKRMKLMDKLNLNKKNLFCRVINKVTYIFNPYKIL